MEWYEQLLAGFLYVALLVAGALLGILIEILLPGGMRRRVEAAKRRTAKWMRNEPLILSSNQDYEVATNEEATNPDVFKARVRSALTQLSTEVRALASSYRIGIQEGGGSLDLTVNWH